MNKEYYIGIDIGGSKVHFGLIDNNFNIINDKKILLKKTGDIKKDLGYIIKNLKKFFNENLIKVKNLKHIGISVPSLINKKRNKIIWSPNIEGWKNFNIKDYFIKELGVNTFIEHDKNAAALGEFEKVYKGKIKNMIFIAIGTGIAAGIIINEKIFYGENNLAGAIGWFINSVEEIHRKREIRSSGWLEINSSGIYFNRISSKFKDIKDDYFFAKKILELYKRGDKEAVLVINRMLDCLGVAVSNILSLLDINTIVIGGGIGLNLGFSLAYLKNIIDENCQPYIAKNVEIRLSKIKNAALIGAVLSLD